MACLQIQDFVSNAGLTDFGTHREQRLPSWDSIMCYANTAIHFRASVALRGHPTPACHVQKPFRREGQSHIPTIINTTAKTIGLTPRSLVREANTLRRCMECGQTTFEHALRGLLHLIGFCKRYFTFHDGSKFCLQAE